MKKRIVIIAYVSIMAFAALMLSPQKSNADVLAYEAVESMEQGIWCDWMDWKNKWFSINCKPKSGHVCETTNCEVIIK